MSQQQKNTNRKGFTLIELLIVVVIIGILAAIAIPKFSSTKEKAYIAGMKSDLKNLVNVEEGFYADSGYYANQASLTGNYAWNTSSTNALFGGGAKGDATGWSAALSNPAVKSVTNCSIFAGSGTAATANNPAGAKADGAPVCK